MCTKGLLLTRYAIWLILTQTEVQWSWNEMVLKGVTRYTFCNNFTNNRSTGLKFWHNVGAYFGPLWCEFQWVAASIVEVTMLVCFWHSAKTAYRWSQWTCWGTIGWEIWNLMADTCFWWEMCQIESKMLNLWWFKQGSWKESKMVLKEPICPFISHVACILNIFGVMVLKWIKISSNFTMYLPYSSKYGCFAQGNDLTDCLQLNIN